MRVFFLALLACTSCATAWERHDESLYATLQDPTSQTYVAHAELLKQTIDNAAEKERRPPAGVCAEYAYYVARLGRKAEAKTYLAMEQQHYPEAATFLVAFERFLEGVTPVPDPKPPDEAAGATGDGAEVDS